MSPRASKRQESASKKRHAIGDLIECWHCAKTFVFTASMKQYRRYCDRNCYREASHDFDRIPYPMIWVNGKRVYLHRYIFAQAHPEITLTSHDLIHHIDENPFNRDISNLELIRADDETARAIHLAKHDYHRKPKPLKPIDPDLEDMPF